MNKKEPVVKDDAGKSRIDLLPESAIIFAKTIVYKFYLEIRENRTEDKLVTLGEMILDHTSLKDVGLVLAFGANKHWEQSWKTIDNPERFWAALGRHLEDEDTQEGSVASDSGFTHMAHAMCNVLFLLDLLYPKKEEQSLTFGPNINTQIPSKNLLSVEKVIQASKVESKQMNTTHNYPND